MKRKQTGFTVVEGLLILVLVAIIGGTGWYVWHSNSQADKISQNIPTSKSKNASSATKTQTSDAGLIAAAIADKCHSSTPSLDPAKVKAANLDVFKIADTNLIVSGNYAGANGTCGESVEPGGGTGFLFKKMNNVWTFVYEGQQQPSCETLDNQGWPVTVLKTFDGTCYDSVNQSYRVPK